MKGLFAAVAVDAAQAIVHEFLARNASGLVGLAPMPRVC